MSNSSPRFIVVPEIMPSTGGAYASELTNSTQSSKVSDIELLFREAIQNSHDQRLAADKTVLFYIQISKLKSAERGILADSIQGVKNSNNFAKLHKIIEDPGHLYLLSFTDAHTKGLNGPTDASIASQDKNFVNFFHKVGRDGQSDSEAGGAFGHGRAVFFNSSQVSTALVYTRFESDGKTDSRFYGMTLGENFSDKGFEFTGKWLWGNSREGKASPITGKKADELAKIFGIFENLSGTTGTSIAILAPRYIDNDNDARKYAETLAYAAEKSIWPHLMSNKDGFQSIGVSISAPGMSQITPSVEEEASRSYKFVKAYRESKSREHALRNKSIRMSMSVEMIRNRKSFALTTGDILGTFYWTRRMLFGNENVENAQEYTPDLVGIPEEFPDLNGIAIFRTPKLIVDYIKPPFPQTDFEVVGFFEATIKSNPFLRASESDTHDTWSDAKLQGILGRGKANPIKRIISQIEEELKTLVPKVDVSQRTMEVALMNDLGAFLSFEGRGVSGPGKPRVRNGGGSGGTSSGSVISITPSSMAGEHAGFNGKKVIGHFKYQISRNPRLENGAQYEIIFIPKVALRDGYEASDDDQNDALPKVIKIISLEQNLLQNSFVSSPEDEPHEITVVIETPANLNVALEFTSKMRDLK